MTKQINIQNTVINKRNDHDPERKSLYYIDVNLDSEECGYFYLMNEKGLLIDEVSNHRIGIELTPAHKPLTKSEYVTFLHFHEKELTQEYLEYIDKMIEIARHR